MRIVTANYRDQKSDHPWLIRDAAQHPEEAVAVKSVIATGVDFCPSTSYEMGFGCTTVAQCQTAERAFDDEQVGARLQFKDGVYYTQEGVQVSNCTLLLLQKNGAAWAVINSGKE